MPGAAPASYFLDLERLPAQARRPGILVRAAWTENLTLSHVTLGPRAIIPLHQHAAEQASVVVSGSVTMSIGQETRVMTAGSCYLIPGHVEHGGQAGPDGACLVDVFWPVREDYQAGAVASVTPPPPAAPR
jgi:quercetin dioxygenase-like cupin family protein